jgi:hypothetical protein
MAKLFGEALLWIIRSIVMDLLWQVAEKVCVWLDANVKGRKTKLVLAGILGIVVYFLFPILLGILGL